MVLQKVNRDVFVHWKGIILYLAINFTDFLYILTIIKKPFIKQKTAGGKNPPAALPDSLTQGCERRPIIS